MKVVVFSQFFPPEMEPSGFMINALATHLSVSDKCERVDVICGFPNFPSGKFLDKKWLSIFHSYKLNKLNIHNVIVIPSDNKSNLKRICNYFSYLISSVLKGVFINSPDVVIATSPPIFSGLYGLVVAKFKRSKFVLDVRDVWPESAVQMGNLNNKYIIKILESLELALYKNSSLITVATPGMVDIVKRKIDGKQIPVEYIPCGVRIPKQENLVKNGENPFGNIDKDKFCVLYGGLHGHAQNLTTLVDSANLLQKREDIVFYFIGDGPDKERVENYASSLNLTNLRFLPPVSRTQIRRFFLFAGCAIVPLQDLDIFKNVYPSKTFELMSYGVPSIVGVGGEIGKLISETGAGVSVTPESSKEYVEAIVKFADDMAFREQTSKKAIEVSKQSFDYNVVNLKFEDLLNKYAKVRK